MNTLRSCWLRLDPHEKGSASLSVDLTDCICVNWDLPPVRLMKRDLLFVAVQLLSLLDEKQLEMVARNRSINAKDGESAERDKEMSPDSRFYREGDSGLCLKERVELLCPMQFS